MAAGIEPIVLLESDLLLVQIIWKTFVTIQRAVDREVDQDHVVADRIQGALPFFKKLLI